MRNSSSSCRWRAMEISRPIPLRDDWVSRRGSVARGSSHKAYRRLKQNDGENELHYLFLSRQLFMRDWRCCGLAVVPTKRHWEISSFMQSRRELREATWCRAEIPKRVSTQCLNRSFPFLIHWYNG